MLVLARYENERIRIGNDIWIQVVKVRENGQVRIGIEAPADVQILREELIERIEGEGGSGGDSGEPQQQKQEPGEYEQWLLEMKRLREAQ